MSLKQTQTEKYSEYQSSFLSPVLHSKHRNKHQVIYLAQYQQAFIVLLVSMEVLFEQEMLFVLDGAECS